MTQKYTGRDGGRYDLILTGDTTDVLGEIWNEVQLPQNEQVPCYWGNKQIRIIDFDGNVETLTDCEHWSSDGFFHNNPENYYPLFVCTTCFQKIYMKPLRGRVP